MKNKSLLNATKKLAFALILFMSTTGLFAQTNVYDDVIATSSNHTYLKAAIDQEGLASALQSSSSNLTVFAPENAAFDSLAAALGTDISGLLALPNLSDILLYHVLGSEISSTTVSLGSTTASIT